MPLPDGSSAAYMFLFHAGPLDEAERAFEPLRRFREPLEDLLAPRLYVEVQQMFDEDLPPASTTSGSRVTSTSCRTA